MRIRNLPAAAVLTASVLAAACQSSPTAPTNQENRGPSVTTLTLSTGGTLEVTGTAQVRAEALYSDGSRADVTTAATWLSESTDLATVAAGGLVSGRAPGRATIRATHEGVTATLAVTVRGRRINFTVEALNMIAIDSCEGALEGPGEFSWRVTLLATVADFATPQTVVLSEPVNGYPNGGVTLERGGRASLQDVRTVQVRSEGGSFVELGFRATETDRSLLPPFATFPDPRLNDANATVRYMWSATNGWAGAFGLHSLTLGNTGCQVRLDYVIETATVD